MTNTRGDALIAHLLDAGSGDGSDANNLIVEFSNGYPVQNLRRLFEGDKDDAVKAGAWIASEIGVLALPLLPDLRDLLRHRLPYVRAFAIDAILLAATADNGEYLAAALERTQDDDDAVRWKAMTFLARATPSQLRATLPHIHNLDLGRQVRWLLANSSVPNDSEVSRAIDDAVRLRRLFGAAVAARVASQTTVPLRYAAQSADPEIASFARGWLRIGVGDS